MHEQGAEACPLGLNYNYTARQSHPQITIAFSVNACH